jgi:hypothetical protein
MERTIPKGEVNEEALLRDLSPLDIEQAIAAELAKVDEEILGGRNESPWCNRWQTHQLESSHYREAQGASQGNGYFGDSSYHNNIFAPTPQRTPTSTVDFTNEVNGEAFFGGIRPPGFGRAARLAGVEQEILGGGEVIGVISGVDKLSIYMGQGS